VRQLLEAVRASGATGKLSDKALKQLVLPFARARMADAVEGGPQVRGPAVAAVLRGYGVSSTWVPSRAGRRGAPFRPVVRRRRTRWQRTHVALSYSPAAAEHYIARGRQLSHQRCKLVARGTCPAAAGVAQRRPRARAQLLATALPFSEAELVAENRGYLLRVLGLDALEVRGASAEAAAAAGRPQLAGAQPGAPVVHFLAPGS